MSDTPRTDLLFKHLIDEGCDFTRPANVMVRHAETLERELAEQSRALSEAVTRGDAYKDAAECRHRERDEWEEKYATLESRCYEGFPSASDGIFDALGESDAQVNDLKHELLEVREYAVELERLATAFVDAYYREFHSGQSIAEKWPGWENGLRLDEPEDAACHALMKFLTEHSAALSKNFTPSGQQPVPEGSTPASGSKTALPTPGPEEGEAPHGVFTDSQRMDWLETRRVIVNSPMRYGSASVFSAQATQHDAEADVDSPLRAFIDQELRAAKAVPSQVNAKPCMWCHQRSGHMPGCMGANSTPVERNSEGT